MPHKCETPRYGGVSRKRCGGCFRDFPTSLAPQAQFEITAHCNTAKTVLAAALKLVWKGVCND